MNTGSQAAAPDARCAKNTGNSLFFTGTKHTVGRNTTEFAFSAARYLQPRPPKPISRPVRLVYRCYRETKHRVDDLNLYEALDDLLVKQGILADDNINIIRSRDGSRCGYDKENPRAEIEIYTWEEETQ